MPQYQGIWTLAQAAQLQSTQRWATDPLFENTTLLLQADNAANGAQNNTFLDSSSNNFTITRNGNTTQGTFTPFSSQPGAWSTFFSSSYLTLADSADWVIDTDYTIEFWAYASSFPGQYNNFINQRGGVSSYWGINYDTSLGWSFFWNNGSGETKVSRYQDSPLNTWVHVAVVKSGTTGYMFLNGVQAGATFTFGSISDVASVLYIGSWFTPGDYFNGYLSNLRLVKGRAVYTSNFTPSTIPLGATSGGTNPPTGTQTKLLMSQSNYFIDNSPSPKTISIGGGTPSVQAFSPFAPQYQYTPSVTGGSGYFDGSGDFLSLASNATFNTSNGDFTFDAWAYQTVRNTNSCTLFSLRASDDGSFADPGINSDGKLQCWNLSGAFGTASTASVPLNAWTHVAFVRSSNVLYYYINGVQCGSTAMTNTWSGTSPKIGGQSWNSAFMFSGYLSNARFIKSAVYAGNFSIPTSPFTASMAANPFGGSNTAAATALILFNFTNAGIYDGTLKNNLETVGNAQVSTAVVKYGTGSMAFDGTGDYLVFPANPLYAFGTGDFTVEAWVYPTSNAAVLNICGTRTSAGTVNGWNWGILTNGSSQMYSNSAIANTGASTVPLNTWTHLAFVRTGGTIYGYVNGVQRGSTANTENFTINTFWVGITGGTAEPFFGYIDDLRITRGIARYTANFIPPSVALPRQ